MLLFLVKLTVEFKQKSRLTLYPLAVTLEKTTASDMISIADTDLLRLCKARGA
jgi:hypothetical protein